MCVWKSHRRPQRLLTLGCLCVLLLFAHAQAWATNDVTSKQDALRFDVWEIHIQGNSLLERQTLERTIYSYMGPDKTIDDVEQARKALELHYRNSGYPTVVVNIPEQDVSKGIVTLVVVEGRISNVYVSGADYFSPKRIRQQVPAVAVGEVPHIKPMQEQIAAVNMASRDRSITPVLRPGRTPGTVEMELKVKDTFPLHGSLEVNDSGSESTSATRLAASLRYANLWQREHSLSLQYQVSPENSDEVQVLSSTYLMRLANSGNLVAAYVVHSESDTLAEGNSTTLGDLNVLGSGDIVGLRWIAPLAVVAGNSQTVSLGMDYKDFQETVTSNDGLPITETPIDYWVLSTRYNATHSIGKKNEKRSLQWGLGANFGVRALGNESEKFTDKRSGAKPSFFYLLGNVEHNRVLTWDMGLRVHLAGQLADTPLISNEQFSAGGAGSVRGYYPSQALGDYGLRGGVELSSPSFTAVAPGVLQDLRVLYFIDAAGLRKLEPLADEDHRFDLLSHGLSLRITAFKSFNAELDVAWALTDLGSIEADEWRTHFKAGYEF